MHIEIGELRDQLSLDLQQKIGHIVSQKANDPNYYILVVAKPDPLDPNQINTTVFTMYEDRLPPIPLIGTICVYIDNQQGKLVNKWCLPRDIPTFGVTEPEQMELEAAENGMRMDPFIYY